VPEDDIHGMVKALLVPLREQLGQPFYEDRLVVAWRLRR
jgi:hypothetical protein